MLTFDKMNDASNVLENIEIFPPQSATIYFRSVLALKIAEHTGQSILYLCRVSNYLKCLTVCQRYLMIDLRLCKNF